MPRRAKKRPSVTPGHQQRRRSAPGSRPLEDVRRACERAPGRAPRAGSCGHLELDVVADQRHAPRDQVLGANPGRMRPSASPRPRAGDHVELLRRPRGPWADGVVEDRVEAGGPVAQASSSRSVSAGRSSRRRTAPGRAGSAAAHRVDHLSCDGCHVDRQALAVERAQHPGELAPSRRRAAASSRGRPGPRTRRPQRADLLLGDLDRIEPPPA